MRSGALLILLLLTGCTVQDSKERGADELRRRLRDDTYVTDVDLDSIIARDTLIALTRYNGNSYFIYKGHTMGYEYELLKLFAKDLGVHLKIKTPSTQDSLFTLLREGKGDLIADNRVITLDLLRDYSASIPHNLTKQVLVQRKPRRWRSMKRHEIENELIRSVTSLAGKVVAVPRGSHYESRLEHIISEIGAPVQIKRVGKDMEIDQLIKLVSDGILDYTLADENIARLNSAFFDNIDVGTPASLDQRVGWVFRKTSPELKKRVNGWIRRMKYGSDPAYNMIYKKYYRNLQGYTSRVQSEQFSLETGVISPWDSLFKAHATEWLPWTLLASISYQESRFSTAAQSRFGARGIMQLLPETAEQFGVSDLSDPAASIESAVKYLQFLREEYWYELPPDEALHFSLASYNAGPGHVLDAQRVARHAGYADSLWFSNVEEAILKLSFKSYIYKDYVRHGYCRGIEPKLYVQDVIDRYERYERALKEADTRRRRLLETFGRKDTAATWEFRIE
ncbi:MAG: transglycosylase SLT domain-containing protein [Fibrobacterota bacterium]